MKNCYLINSTFFSISANIWSGRSVLAVRLHIMCRLMLCNCCRSRNKRKRFRRNGTSISKIYERDCCKSMRYGDTRRIFSIVFREIKTFNQSFVENIHILNWLWDEKMRCIKHEVSGMITKNLYWRKYFKLINVILLDEWRWEKNNSFKNFILTNKKLKTFFLFKKFLSLYLLYIKLNSKKEKKYI